MARLTIHTKTGRLTRDAQRKITEAVELDRKIAELKAQADGIKVQLKEAIEAEGINGIETENYKVIYKAPTVRNGVDTKRMKTEAPELYKKYLKTSKVASSISIKNLEQA